MTQNCISGRIITVNNRVTIKDSIVFFACMFCTIFVIYFNDKDYYSLLPLLPFSYGLLFLVILSPVIHCYNFKTGVIVAFCEFLRCVFLPVVIAASDYSGFGFFSTKDKDLLDHAMLLMVYELFAIFLCTRFFFKKYYTSFLLQRERKIGLSEEKYIIFLFLLLGLMLYFLFPQIQNEINFLFLSVNNNTIQSSSVFSSSVMTGIIRFCHFSFLGFFILILNYCSKLYNNYSNKKYIYLSMFVGLCTTGIILGHSRATVIYILFAVYACLAVKFPDNRKKITTFLLLGGGGFFLGMTIYRFFRMYSFETFINLFYLGAYYNKDNYWLSFFEAYFLGPQTIAAGIAFQETFSDLFTLERFFIDLLRPFMGLNLILKDANLETTIKMYNSWLLGIDQSYGVFLQITNQCYCYFGFLFSPLFACFFIWLSFKLESLMRKTNNLYIFFFLNFIYIRVSTAMLGGTMSGFITTCSMTILIIGFMLLIQLLFRNIVRGKFGL